jgi:hypothetical protein
MLLFPSIMPLAFSYPPLRLDELRDCQLFLDPSHRVLILFFLSLNSHQDEHLQLFEPRMVGKLFIPIYHGSRTHMGASSSFPSAHP